MDVNSILDFIKENSWIMGSGGLVGLIVLLKSIFNKPLNGLQKIRAGKNSINIQVNNDMILGDINNVRETKDRNRG